MDVDVDAVIEAAEKAAASDGARAAIAPLLEGWRTSPASAFAEAIERLSELGRPQRPPPWEECLDDPLETGRLVDRLREGNAATAVGLIVKLRAAKDPRVAAACVRLLEDPPWHATGSQAFWTKLFALLAAHPDPRSLAKLAAIAYAKIIKGNSMRTWMTDKVAKAIASLEQQLAGTSVVKLTKQQSAALAKIEPKPARKSLAPKANATAKPAASEAELFRAVYENPEDDAARVVLGDWLLERNDPRGELISLQLAPTEKGDKRALGLLRKHQRAWLGPVAPYVKYVGYPSVAAEDPLGLAMWWRRGFLAGCQIALTRPKLYELGELPIWSTVERMSYLSINADDWEEGVGRLLASARSLRVLYKTDARVLHVASKLTRLRKQLERVALPSSNDELPTLVSELETFEGLRHLELRPPYQEQFTLAPLLRSTVMQRLLKLYFETAAGSLELTRTALTEPFAVRAIHPRVGLQGIAEQLPSALSIGDVTFDGADADRKAELTAALAGRRKK